MKILGIDTTTKFLCLGIYNDGRLYEYNLELGRQLASLVTVSIKRALEAAGLSVKDLDCIACGLGPGSFTAIRVGLATVKAISLAIAKPVVGIPTLEILAKNAGETDRRIFTVVDAKRNLIYCGVYVNKDGKLKSLSPNRLLTEEEFLKKIKTNAIILGDALGLYKEKILRAAKGAVILDRDYWYPRAHNIIELALEKIASGKIGGPGSVKPIYIYPKECQIRKRL